MGRNKVGYVENLIDFETAPKPLVTKTDFPYRKVLDSLKALDATKSLVFDSDKFPYYRLQRLRIFAGREGLGYIKQCKKGEKVYVWMNEPNGGENGKVL